jgi:hypothetical protein
MALCGERNVKDIGPQNVMIPQGFLDEYDVQAPMRASQIAPVAV